jgi:hypothetical protein
VVEQRLEVGGERVVVVALPGLRRVAEATAVVRDHAVAGVDQRRHLVLPRAPAQGPAVDQDNWTVALVAVVLEVQGDGEVSGVGGLDVQVRHGALLGGCGVELEPG